MSFNKYHFGWKINIYYPIRSNTKKTQQTSEQKDIYTGINYFSQLYNIPNINIHKIQSYQVSYCFYLNYLLMTN